MRTTHARAQARIDRVHVGSTVISAPTSIDVPAPIRAITVAFTANSYVDPEHVQFRYRLAGGSAAWTDIGSQPAIAVANKDHFVRGSEACHHLLHARIECADIAVHLLQQGDFFFIGQTQ